MKGNRNFMRGFLATIWSLFSMAYFAAITFLPIPTANVRIADTVTGFILGTIIGGGIFAYYYSTSQSSSEKNELLKDKNDSTSSIKTEVHVAEKPSQP